MGRRFTTFSMSMDIREDASDDRRIIELYQVYESKGETYVTKKLDSYWRQMYTDTHSFIHSVCCCLSIYVAHNVQALDHELQLSPRSQLHVISQISELADAQSRQTTTKVSKLT